MLSVTNLSGFGGGGAGTVAPDATLDGVTFGNEFDPSDLSNVITGVCWVDGGDRLLVGEFGGYFHMYDCSTAYDISTATRDTGNDGNIRAYTGGYGNGHYGWFLNDAGTKLWVMSSSTHDIRQVTLSTAYDLTSDSDDGQWNNPELMASPRNMHWNSDGTEFTISGVWAELYTYSVSTAYDVTSTTAEVKYADYGKGTALDGTDSLQCWTFSHDGTYIYLVGENNTVDVSNDYLIQEWALSTAYDIETATKITGSYVNIETLPDPTNRTQENYTLMPTSTTGLLWTTGYQYIEQLDF